MTKLLYALYVVATVLILLIVATKIYSSLYPEEFIFYSEKPHDGYTWDAETPPYIACSDNIPAYNPLYECKWENVPVGKNNAYVVKNRPLVAKLALNQIAIFLFAIFLSSLILSIKHLKKQKV